MRKSCTMILLLATLLLASCAKLQKQFSAFTPDRNTAYLKHDVAEPMEIPANLSVNSEEMRNYYPLPKGPLPAEGAKPVDIVPPPVVRYQETQEHLQQEQESNNG